MGLVFVAAVGASLTLMRWGTDPAIQAAGNFAFLLVKNLADLHADLRAGSTGFYAVEVPLPDRVARLAFVEWYLATRPVESDLTPAELEGRQMLWWYFLAAALLALAGEVLVANRLSRRAR